MTNYHIVRLQGIGYENAIEGVYRKYPELSNQPFEVQKDVILEEKLCHATGFTASMNIIGNEAHEILYDCRIMQQTWARERGLKYQEKSWQTDILLAQLRELKPDVVFFQDIFSMPADMRVSLKELVTSIRVKAIQKGYPGETRDLSDADVLFVSSPILYERYRALRPYLVYHPFDVSVLKRLREKVQAGDEQRVAFTFSGSTRAPELRYWMLRELLRKTDIEIWGEENIRQYLRYGGNPGKGAIKSMLRTAAKTSLISIYGDRLPAFLKGQYIPRKLKNLVVEVEESSQGQNKQKELDGLKQGTLPRKTLSEMFPYRCHEPLFGIDYYRLLMRSDIVFNLHSTAAGNTVDNMKMFETTGVGACLLTDTGSNMKDLFEEDKEVVTYSSVDEAIEKATYLVDHAGEAKQIAESGQARTLRDHTVMNRCQQIDEVIQKTL